jgi:hypothetical protein
MELPQDLGLLQLLDAPVHMTRLQAQEKPQLLNSEHFFKYRVVEFIGFMNILLPIFS